MTDEKGKVTGHIGKDTIVVDGKEIPYEKAFEKNTDEKKGTTDN